MSVRLRLSPHRRLPSSQQIYYRIVAINAPRARDSKPLDTIGAYDPVPQHLPVVPASERSLLDEGKEPEMRWIKRVEWDREKVGYWISVGAQPSRRVAWLLQKDKLIPPGKSFHGFRGPPKPKAKQEDKAAAASDSKKASPKSPKPKPASRPSTDNASTSTTAVATEQSTASPPS